MAWRKPGNLREWVHILLAHKKKFLFPALGVATVVVLGSFGLERQYRAENKFERRNENAVSQGGKVENTYQEQLRMLLVEDLGGKPAVEQLIEDMGMTKDLPRREDGTLTDEGMRKKALIIDDFRSRLSVRFQTRSALIDVVTVAYADKDPRFAPEVTNRLVANYLRKTREKLEGTLKNAEVFLQKEVDRYRSEVQELERKKIRFEQDNVGLNPNDALALQTRKNEMIARRSALVQQLEVTRAELARKEEFVHSQPENITTKKTGRNPEYDQLLGRKGQLENDLDVSIHVKGMTDVHPTVVKTRVQIAELEKKMAATLPEVELGEETVPNSNRIQATERIKTMEGTIEAMTAQKAALDEEVQHYENMDRQFLALRAEYVRLDRDLGDANAQLKVWEDNLNRASIALKTEVSARGQRFSVIQNAEIASASRPTLMGVLAIAAVAGLGIGSLMILLAELLDHSFRTVDQAVDELKLPVLGAIAEISTPARAMRDKIMAWAVMPAIGAAMVVVLAGSIWLVYLSLERPQQFQDLVGKRLVALKVWDRAA